MVLIWNKTHNKTKQKKKNHLNWIHRQWILHRINSINCFKGEGAGACVSVRVCSVYLNHTWICKINKSTSLVQRLQWGKKKLGVGAGIGSQRRAFWFNQHFPIKPITNWWTRCRISDLGPRNLSRSVALLPKPIAIPSFVSGWLNRTCVALLSGWRETRKKERKRKRKKNKPEFFMSVNVKMRIEDHNGVSRSLFNCQVNFRYSTWRKCTCKSKAVNYSRLEQFNEISVYLVSRSVSGSNKGRSAETVSLSALLTRVWIFSFLFSLFLSFSLSIFPFFFHLLPLMCLSVHWHKMKDWDEKAHMC